ncbi:hypothetical protein BSLG_001602 [Batrachochytrium salamandrivorans]|nr:hypothetical protein BASA62_006321 [Batrachochytrium salamandrivorans]KAJ1336651.1 hypothetical protein BSLG_006970 [Batrachochytrium salamandrivorans]KAJ1336853.1 hypothetical protein BSLG_006956 [Batrachochytrium salamandrivorans]KAJ1343870.1 hypothetical protein BSLG_001602 [Batrachochytrium salamandrivorans]
MWESWINVAVVMLQLSRSSAREVHQRRRSNAVNPQESSSRPLQRQQESRPAAPQTHSPTSRTEASAARDHPLRRVLCSICLSRPIGIVLVPCGHITICDYCFGLTSRNSGCPICRRQVTSAVKFFIAGGNESE